MKYALQPPKAFKVPQGSTHWVFGAEHPFFKIVMEPCGLVLSQALTMSVSFCFTPPYDSFEKGVAYVEVNGRWLAKRVYQFYDGEWLFVEARRFNGGLMPSYGSLDFIELCEIKIPENAQTVETIYGEAVLLGVIVKGGRVVVDLAHNPFGYRPVCLREGEIISKPAT